MDFELTISGLSVIVLKATRGETRPVHPIGIDVVCPKDDMHRPRLTYLPELFAPLSDNPEVEMVVDTMGHRIASMDLRDLFLELTFGSNPTQEFAVPWGPERAQRPPHEEWLNWVPTLGDLGFEGFRMGSPGQLPDGASTRLTLPKGEIFSRNIVRDSNSSANDYAIWQFPAAGDKERALANEVVFRASGVEDIFFKNREGVTLLSGSGQSGSVVRMCICNDLAVVPLDYNRPLDSLIHLEHLAALSPLRAEFQAPTLVPARNQRTDTPICNQAVHVDDHT